MNLKYEVLTQPPGATVLCIQKSVVRQCRKRSASTAESRVQSTFQVTMVTAGFRVSFIAGVVLEVKLQNI